MEGNSTDCRNPIVCDIYLRYYIARETSVNWGLTFY